jgi:hypothetical protein
MIYVPDCSDAIWTLPNPQSTSFYINPTSDGTLPVIDFISNINAGQATSYGHPEASNSDLTC